VYTRESVCTKVCLRKCVCESVCTKVCLRKCLCESVFAQVCVHAPICLSLLNHSNVYAHLYSVLSRASPKEASALHLSIRTFEPLQFKRRRCTFFLLKRKKYCYFSISVPVFCKYIYSNYTTHTHTHIYTHIHTHIHIHTHTHTYTQTLIRTHIHTHRHSSRITSGYCQHRPFRPLPGVCVYTLCVFLCLSVCMWSVCMVVCGTVNTGLSHPFQVCVYVCVPLCVCLYVVCLYGCMWDCQHRPFRSLRDVVCMVVSVCVFL